MFGFSTPDSNHDTERRFYEEGEWYGVESGQNQVVSQMAVVHGVFPVQSQAMALEARPVYCQFIHGVQYGQNQAVTQVPVAHVMYPVHYHALAREEQPVQYQLAHNAQSGQYQEVTPMPLEHGMYPVQYHAMELGSQPVMYERMNQVPASQGGQLHNMLVGGQVQVIDSSIQPQLTYMHPQVQSGRDTSPPVLPASQVDCSGFCHHEVELLEIARVTFSSARQGENESVDDWADRVCTLAGNAYRDLSDDYVLQKSILRFCMGAKEREAGERVINQWPVSIELAIDLLKWDIFTHGTMYRPKLLHKVECARQVKVVGEKWASQGMLVDGVEAVEKKVDMLEEKIDICMGKLDQLLARPTRSLSPSPVRQQYLNCNTMGHFKQECPNSINNDKGQSVIVGQMKSDSMSRIDANMNDLAIQAEDTLVLDRVVVQLPEKLPVFEQVREWVVHKYADTIDGVGAALGLSGQVVYIAQERNRTYGLGKGKDMLHCSRGCVVVKAVSDFRFIQEWLIHGTDPPGNECLTSSKKCSFNLNRGRRNTYSLNICKLDKIPVLAVREQESCSLMEVGKDKTVYCSCRE
ncbi:hypothetical protein DPMN_022239 [Dreissena polymorpha]|uniref:Uncharacterized protein n=1 Tax=Dreissena polymorpha TaxID=45954 RepID=A0A9D4NK08_DREPO|nr:hypothetical protein DPMN_022239 [Dreissena polymorpha]